MTTYSRRVPDLIKWIVTIALFVCGGLIVRHDRRMVLSGGTPFDGSMASDEVSRARYDVTRLASNQMAGRLTGTPGEAAAADFIVGELKRIGAAPLPGKDFLFPFQFTAGGKDGGSTITVSTTCKACPPVAAIQGTSDVQALSFSDDGTITAPVVFAGYGIVVPESQDFGYDSYATLDVKDKIVLVLRYFPEDADQKTKGILSRYADLRFKALAARQRGAKALIVVTGPHSPNAGETIPMTFDTALAGSGIVAASISAQVAGSILADSGKTLDEVQHALDSANPHIAGFQVSNRVLTIHTAVVRERKTGHDIVAYLPATGNAADTKPWIALGAHYDHLGHGEAGSSLATKEDAGKIHPGADDNASGDAAVLAIGESLAKEQQRPRGVLLDFWSGEELGLIGSEAFVKAPPVPLDKIEAYLNFDMVGRMQDNKLTVQATGTSDVWPKVLEQANVAAGFDLLLQPDPYQPTDVASFNEASVPCLAFFTGTHEDYHKPSDTADKIDYDDLARVADFAAAIVRKLEAMEPPPAFTKVEQKASSGPGLAGVRVTTGTIPDYSTDVKGLLLAGVIGGGPAEQAGLKKGDVIIEIAGQTITNIYDYTYALDVLKIGEPVKLVYLRDGRRNEVMLTPAARK
jgi:hypothetical protein